MAELDINPRIINAIKRAHLEDHSRILSLSAPDIQRLTQLPLNDIQELQKAVAHKIHRITGTTALELYQKSGPPELKRENLTTGCPYLDSFLRGGILSQALTEISGESASGKTQLCLQLCLTVQLPIELGGLEGGAVYISTEDIFPNKRLLQMITQLKLHTKDVKVKAISFTDNIYIEHARELVDLYHCLSKKIPVLLTQRGVKLVIIDSVAALFRCEHNDHSLQERAKLMQKIASELLQMANKYNIPTICVNQVSDLINDSLSDGLRLHKVVPALGISWANHVTVRLLLTRTNQKVTALQKNVKGDVIGSLEVTIRIMEVLFAPHLPGTLCKYIVDQDGVKGLPY